MQKRTKWNLYKWWYALCFVFLGIIDQRRGSALGAVQMTFANLTGVVMALLLLPSIKLEKGKAKPYLIWTPICIALGIITCAFGMHYWQYKGQWITAVLNVVVWSYLLIYICREKSHTQFSERVKQPFFWILCVCFWLMQISVHEGIVPIWYILIYGGFALIGIPCERTDDFFDGMLTGIILWFFGQQIIAFGFRPYDYVRYRGLYSGETQNGMHYMLVFCAFLLKWLYSKDKKEKWFLRFFYFLMSAGLISFTVFTGGKGPILGILAVTVFVFISYNLFKRKTFYGLLVHSIVLLFCVILTFPISYLCIRYLPTILHHPIWFEGEYVEGQSVCSFDSWDSSKYISFENVMYSDVSRILEFVGIEPEKWTEQFHNLMQTMAVHAEELEIEKKSVQANSQENPFVMDGYDAAHSSNDARKVIYAYYAQNLNFRGHDKEHSGFYFSDGTYLIYYEHAHNMFLQVAYDYGIIPGILFLIIYLYSMYRAFRLCSKGNWTCMVFLIVVLCFGMVEMVLVSGQITVSLMAIMFYFVGRDGYTINNFGEDAKHYDENK